MTGAEIGNLGAADGNRPAQTVPLLKVQSLTAGYGATAVLYDISFEVGAGELLAILGTNGAGKSTLLKRISGIIRPLSGHIHFAGQDISATRSMEIVRLGVSLAPEGRRLFTGLTVEENLRLGAYGRRDKSTRIIAQALEQVFTYFPRLRERRRQLAGTLSGGEQQMCALGRALMAAPRLLLIDELSLGLAPVIVEELLHILHDIHADGTTILLVEQDAAVALGFSDRAIVLQTGRLVLAGNAADLLENEDVIKSYLGG